MSEDLTYAEAAALYEKLEARAATLPSRQIGANRTSFLRHRRLTYTLVACTTTAAVIIAAIVISGEGSHHPSAAANGRGQQGQVGPGPSGNGNGILGFQAPPIGSNPFAYGGRQVALAQASLLLGFQVPTPNTPLANPSNLSSIWFSPVGNGSGTRGEVMLDYVATRIQISVKPANRILSGDAREAFKREANELHMSPGVLTIAGAPALVVGGDPGNPGFAEIARGGLDIAVMGHRSAADLVAIARSLSPEAGN